MKYKLDEASRSKFIHDVSGGLRYYISACRILMGRLESSDRLLQRKPLLRTIFYKEAPYNIWKQFT